MLWGRMEQRWCNQFALATEEIVFVCYSYGIYQIAKILVNINLSHVQLTYLFGVDEMGHFGSIGFKLLNSIIFDKFVQDAVM